MLIYTVHLVYFVVFIAICADCISTHETETSPDILQPETFDLSIKFSQLIIVVVLSAENKRASFIFDQNNW